MSNSTVLEAQTTEDRLFGAAYIMLSVVGASLYVPCLVVMRTDQDLKRHSCLRIMFNMGICDMWMLSNGFLNGVLSLTGYAHTAPYWLNRSLTTMTAVVGWYGHIGFSHILAIGRCLVHMDTGIEHTLFSSRATTLWISVGWSYTLLWLLCHFSPFGGLYYYGSLRCYYFDLNIHPWVRLVDWYNCLISLTAIVIWNTVSVWAIHKMRTETASTEVQRMERRLFYQSALICLFLVIHDQFWHNGLTLLCPIVGIYCYPIGAVLCLVNASINSIV